MFRIQYDPKVTETGFLARFRALWSDLCRVTRQLQAPPVVFVRGAEQTINTNAVVQFTAVSNAYDTHAYFASNKFTPLETGYYRCIATVTWDSSPSSSNSVVISLRKNGVDIAFAYGEQKGSTDKMTLVCDRPIWLDGIADYVEVYAWTDASQALTAGYATTFSASFIGDNAIT